MAKLFYEIREGSEEAFVELVTKYKSFMTNVCYSVLKDSTRAKDLVPRIISMLPNLILSMKKPECKAQTFLHAVCYNESRNALRGILSRNRGENAFALKSRNMFQRPDPYPSDLRIILKHEARVISKMSYVCQKIYYILREYDISQDWISVLLDIPGGTCRSCIHTIRNTLREDKKLIELRKEIFGK